MGTTSKQVMDIKTSKGLSQTSNEELRAWTDKGWEQAMREGNYDRSREHLNFEVQKGGIVTPIDKKRPLTKRMAENLASRGIKDPNEGLAEPRFRTVVNFIFGGSTDRMRELAFGNQVVDFESKGGNEHVRRMPEIEEWARDIYRFVTDKYGEENIISFIVHCDEKNPHVHCALLPIDQNGKFAFKQIFHGQNRLEFKNYMLALHDELAKVNEKWGLTRGVSVVESGAKHRSTEEYRRWLANACVTLEAQLENNSKLLKSLNEELAIAQKKQKSFTTMIDNLIILVVRFLFGNLLHVEISLAIELGGLELGRLLNVHAITTSCLGLDKITGRLATNPSRGHIRNFTCWNKAVHILIEIDGGLVTVNGYTFF